MYLDRIARPLRCEVMLVESANIGTIGVGEATIPTLVHFVRMLNLDEKEFMRRCSATFKLGIRFDDWVDNGSIHWHPFGLCGARVNGLDLFHFWLKRRLETGSKLNYFDFPSRSRLPSRRKPRGLGRVVAGASGRRLRLPSGCGGSCGLPEGDCDGGRGKASFWRRPGCRHGRRAADRQSRYRRRAVDRRRPFHRRNGVRRVADREGARRPLD